MLGWGLVKPNRIWSCLLCRQLLTYTPVNSLVHRDGLFTGICHLFPTWGEQAFIPITSKHSVTLSNAANHYRTEAQH